MSERDETFFKRLLSTFKSEAEEHIVKISSGLIELEQTPESAQRASIIEEVFREAHSLKGGASALNLGEIERICQAMESMFSALKRSEIGLSQPLFDLLHRCLDMLGQLMSSLEGRGTAPERAIVTELVSEVERIARQHQAPVEQALNLGRSAQSTAREEQSPPTGIKASEDRTEAGEDRLIRRPASDAIRVSSTKLDAILLQVEELLAQKFSLAQRISDVREIKGAISSWKGQSGRSLRGATKLPARMTKTSEPDARAGLNVAAVIDFVERHSQFLELLEEKVAAHEKHLEQDRRSFSSVLDGLLEDTRKALMLPFSSLFEILPKLVRDLSHAEGKIADLTITGSSLEVDRRILEEIKDPLIHLVRNCIDHGIEKPDERVRLNKPARGTVTVTVTPLEGNRVEIAISDDGGGIDIDKLKAGAVRAGVASRAEVESMSHTNALALLFVSGVSTSPIITDVSGRGLGLAIVHERVERIGGKVSVDTKTGIGTTFRAILPITLATFRGILVRVEESLIIVPAGNVERVLRLAPSDVRLVENRETIQLEGRALSLARLGDVLGIARKQSSGVAAPRLHAVVLAAGDTHVAFCVDEILGEQEVLAKSLGKQLSRVKNFAGATVLGTGKVVPILNPSDAIKSAAKAPSIRPEALPEAGKIEGEKSLLVVEDSVTARTLLKNILESAGYKVKTAVDGMDGFTLLKTEHFDLAVSDVDMPRMNGFELTARIRADKRLADLPVVLVTALESRADREHGVDVGANAYVVKSSFDQSNLLEVIGRLL